MNSPFAPLEARSCRMLIPMAPPLVDTGAWGCRVLGQQPSDERSGLNRDTIAVRDGSDRAAIARRPDRFAPRHKAMMPRGDVEAAQDEIDHQPVAGPGEPCICLAATDAPLRSRALIPWLLQPNFRS